MSSGTAHSAPFPPPVPQPVAPDPLAEPLQAPPLVQLGFWQRPAVQNLLPLGTSIAFHLALILLGVLTFKTVKVMTEPPR